MYVYSLPTTTLFYRYLYSMAIHGSIDCLTELRYSFDIDSIEDYKLTSSRKYEEKKQYYACDICFQTSPKRVQ